MAKKDDECVELKNIKYQTMLMNKNKTKRKYKKSYYRHRTIFEKGKYAKHEKTLEQVRKINKTKKTI